jgi:hypothetical protein
MRAEVDVETHFCGNGNCEVGACSRCCGEFVR